MCWLRMCCRALSCEWLVVSGTLYTGRWWLSSLKSPPPLQGASCPCYLRGLHQSDSRSPAQAWQGVLVAGSAMQRSSCPRSAVPRGCEKQARVSLHPRTSLAPSAQGRAGVPTDSADSLLGAPALADPYFRFLCDKEFVSAKQTTTHRLRAGYGPSALEKPGLAGLSG